MKKLYLLVGLMILVGSCDEPDTNLPTVEERAAKAKSDLIDKLTAPPDGWRLAYQPVSGSGVFLILLDFNRDGLVRIQSDVGAEDGVYYDQTIPYRVDNSQYLELVFETFGVFHYLFELDQASYGAEFEFLFIEESEGDLIFLSKSDVGVPSAIRLEPSAGNEESLFSREQASAFLEVSGISPVNFFGLPRIYPTHQLYFSDLDISLFWGVDQSKRILFIDRVVSGSAGSGELIQAFEEEMGYTFLAGALVFEQPIQFSFSGVDYVVDRFELDSFSETGGDPFCETNSESLPTYSGFVEDLGNFVLSPSLYNGSGLQFSQGSESSFSVNIPFIFDEEINSLADEGGIIYENFPSSTGFLMNFGLESDSLPALAIGLIVEDEAGIRQLYLKEYQVIAHEGNRLQISFLDTYFLTGSASEDTSVKLSAVLDEIFEGGTVFIYFTPFDGTPLFRLFNPCNRYEIFLVG